MKYLPRLLGLSLLGLLMALLVMSCETSKPTGNEFGSPNRVKGVVNAAPESRQIARVTDKATEYITPRNEVAQAFIRQFGDGTVVDKIQVRKAPVGANEQGNYYLIGMGLRNGMFRAMALPLSAGGDNTFSLQPNAERYTLTSVGCSTCFFDFENGHIVGTSCDSNSGGSRCDLKVAPNNTLFAAK